MRRAAEDSLRRLGTDRIDLYQLHQPDPTVPIADTLGALDELVRAGKVREIGCSNFSAEQLARRAPPCEPGAARFVSVQNEYSLLHREAERDVLPECATPRARVPAVLPAGERPAHRQVPARRAAARGRRASAGWAAATFLTDERLAIVEALRRSPVARPHAAGAGVLVAGVAADRRLGDRRRDVARAGAGERDRGGAGG